MIAKQLDLHLRMRATLAGIADLDPEMVATRIGEMDWEIDRLTALLEAQRDAHDPACDTLASSGAIEIVPIGLRAA